MSVVLCLLSMEMYSMLFVFVYYTLYYSSRTS
jgi:hypothetical protein